MRHVTVGRWLRAFAFATAAACVVTACSIGRSGTGLASKSGSPGGSAGASTSIGGSAADSGTSGEGPGGSGETAGGAAGSSETGGAAGTDVGGFAGDASSGAAGDTGNGGIAGASSAGGANVGGSAGGQGGSGQSGSGTAGTSAGGANAGTSAAGGASAGAGGTTGGGGPGGASGGASTGGGGQQGTGGCNHPSCDLDCDGHLRADATCGGDDCCDADPLAHPGQTGWFSGQDACGNFDYDCDGTEEKRTPQGTACHKCDVGFSCCSDDGFVDAPPPCGASAMSTGCDGWPDCSNNGGALTETCH